MTRGWCQILRLIAPWTAGLGYCTVYGDCSLTYALERCLHHIARISLSITVIRTKVRALITARPLYVLLLTFLLHRVPQLASRMNFISTIRRESHSWHKLVVIYASLCVSHSRNLGTLCKVSFRAGLTRSLCSTLLQFSSSSPIDRSPHSPYC